MSEEIKVSSEAWLDFPPVANPLPYSVASLALGADTLRRRKTDATANARAEELTALYQFTDKLYRATSLDQISDAALDAIARALRCHRSAILLFDETGLMRFVAWRGLSADYRKAVEGHTPWQQGEREPRPVCVEDIDAADLPQSLKEAVKSEGIRALAFIPLLARDGVVGKFMTYYETPHAFQSDELSLAIDIARQLSFGVERLRAEQARDAAVRALRASEALLEQELADSRLLQSVGAKIIEQEEAEDIYEEVLDAAVRIMRSDMASMQVVDEKEDALRLLAFRGFDPEFGQIFRLNRRDTRTSCSFARKLGRRVIVSDVETCDFIVGTAALADHRRSGIRAVQSTPLVSRGGKLIGMISTYWRHAHQPAERNLRMLDILARQAADLLESKQAQAAVRQLAAVVESSDDAIITKNLDGIITSWNKGAERIFGYPAQEVIGKHITILIPQDRRSEEDKIIEQIRRGQRVEHFETVRQRKDGTRIDISLTISPLRTAQGKIVGASKIGRDITERKRAEEQIVTLAREAEHRAKNILANVQATVRLSNADTPEGLKRSIEGRIQALANVHRLFVESRWAGVDLHSLIKQELSPFCQQEEERALISGPVLSFEPDVAQAIAVTLHELTTNAAKYGALSVPKGRVEIEWSQAPDGRLVLRWTETGGPRVTPPTRHGFGTRVVETMIRKHLKGEVNVDWRADGLICEIALLVTQAQP
jgi:PAS domain S-box-containing protein